MKLPQQLHHWLKKLPLPPILRIQIDPSHLMAVLMCRLDWVFLEQIAVKYRDKVIKNAAGKKPHLRIMLGAVVVRCLESCTLRKTAELVRYYAPARYLCNLGPLSWNPDYRTIFDFEAMLGQDGLTEINNYVLQTARKAGFADIRGLCSDTTAQEARIPHPTEVGLINSFAKSVCAGVVLLAKKSSAIVQKICAQTAVVKKLVRKHRLFCKTTLEKRPVEKQLLSLAVGLRHLTATFLKSFCQKKTKLRGQQLKAQSRLTQLIEVFQNLEPQIAYYLKHHTPTKDKIISIFQPLLRSIVRGKAGKAVEFGLKWGINQIRGGYISLYFLTEKAGEPDYAVAGVEQHIELFGRAPRDFGYDRGGWSIEHLKAIKKLVYRILQLHRREMPPGVFLVNAVRAWCASGPRWKGKLGH